MIACGKCFHCEKQQFSGCENLVFVAADDDQRAFAARFMIHSKAPGPSSARRMKAAAERRVTGVGHRELRAVMAPADPTLSVDDDRAVHVNRVLKDLRGSSLIEWKGARVEILDWDRLCHLA